MNLILRTLKYIKPYNRHLFVSFLCMFGYVIFSAFSITLIMPFLDTIFETNFANFTTAPKIQSPDKIGNIGVIKKAENKIHDFRKYLLFNLNNFFVKQTKRETLSRLCLFLFIGFFLKNFFSFSQVYFSSIIEQNVVRDFRRDLFNHLQSVSLDFYHKEKVGNLVSRITNDVSYIHFMIAAIMSSFSRDPLLLLIYLGMMFILSWKLTFYSLITIPFLAVIVTIVGKAIRKYAIRSHQRIADISTILFECFSGIRVVKAFNAENHIFKRYMTEVEQRRTACLKMQWSGGVSSPANELLGVTAGILILWFGGLEVINKTSLLTGGGFILFLFAMFSTIQPLKAMGELWTNIKQGMAASERIFQILDIKPSVTNKPHAGNLDAFKKEIRFENTWFSYLPDRWVLKNINEVIPYGKVIALVGPSGTGKSTLSDLILRFYDPQKGNITIDGINIRDITVESLRNKISVVTQDTILFHDTVKNNISFGLDNVSMERIEYAAQIANAHNFINEFPKKYDTIIGDRGVTISGGQRQRLAIARAVLRDSPILILDEATSSLDSESERLVQDSIEKMMKNRTVLVIAHRFSTVQNADKIWVMDNGEIVHRGTHTELLKESPLYSRLYSEQFLTAR